MKTIQPLLIGGHKISPIVVSTMTGQSGRGIFPLTLFPDYLGLTRSIKICGITSLTKSSTCQKHTGNFRLFNPLTWKYIQKIDNHGLLNAYGLTNHGVAVNAKEIALANKNGFDVIPNLYPQFAKGRNQAVADTLLAISDYANFMGPFFWALELNFSCPNSKEKIRENMLDALASVAAIKFRYPRLCLIAKISIVHPHEFAQGLIDAGVDIIHAINTIPYDLVYPNGPPSPLRAVGGGGVSGEPAFKQALDYNSGLRQKIPKTPIIMGCGVMSAWDANAYFAIGADAVSICTVCRLNPKEAIKIIKKCA